MIVSAKSAKEAVAKYLKKTKGGRRRRQRSGVMKKQITGNFASRMEQFSLAITAGQVYDFTLDLNDLPVCTQVAALYQYYRITSVELRFKPNTDTYISNGAGGSSTGFIPNLNFQYDKSGDLQGTLNAANFEQLGTKSYRLDDKTLIRRWKPSVVTMTGATTSSQFKVSPWMPTHDTLGSGAINNELHYGAVFYISKSNANDTQVYDVDVVVNVQFRKPYVAAVAGQSVKPPRVIQGPSSGHLESTPIQN